jgi:PTH1 family peptidyl-tRNA hydrolase
MYLVVGLGNYGSKYTMNRHNIGFMCVDVWLKSLGENPSDSSFRAEHKALTQKIKITRAGEEKEILIAKPQTYMNKSGESVVSLMQFYKIQRPNLIVVQDDIDQAFGAMKIQFNRGHGGQNGIRNISELFGAADYHRLKLGVGRPEHPGFDIGDYVLGNFPKDELSILPQFLEKGSLAIESFIFDGASKAATKYNGNL